MMTENTQGATRFWSDEDGLGTLEMILIIAVLIAVVLVFREEIVKVVEKLIATAGDKSQEVFE
ncbi:Flp1 family type IVb pilin [Paenibacillus sp. MMS20-IR301]|uniref:Flp1 family type IVb pilin n=1 Tax=Paenibacillus sp. MMS20-IR301 TaxID=2895946 RepID=UPI0028EC9C47|nr:Flp1 family type IVb pilin [Paenibacillus sp. MMS20-IR301]WNS41035.1 Flp1 family type IVb pilin [Paenibacillus sp. MMS20-IR301]